MKLAITGATVGVLAFTALGFATVAQAAPTGNSSAADTVKDLRAEGHTVRINGAATSPLSECRVTAVHPGSTVYVDIACPPAG